MSELRTFVCDICGEKIAPELAALDLGVWFNGGQIGIPHVCPRCQEKTTIAECHQRLRLKEAERASRPTHGTVRVGRQRFTWKLRADGVTFDVRDGKGRPVGQGSSMDESLRLEEVTRVIRRARR